MFIYLKRIVQVCLAMEKIDSHIFKKWFFIFLLRSIDNFTWFMDYGEGMR